jgi:hypothetical protein
LEVAVEKEMDVLSAKDSRQIDVIEFAGNVLSFEEYRTLGVGR